MTIDWDTHCRRIVAELQDCRRLLVLDDVDNATRQRMAVLPLDVAIRMLRSRHIPTSVRDEYPAIPWAGLIRLGAYMERVRFGWWPGVPDPDLITDIVQSVLPRVITEVGRMREALAGSDVDGDLCPAVLEMRPRGAFAHITLRIPQHHVARLWGFLREAYADEPALTIADVRARLSRASEALAAVGIKSIDVFGSVAAAVASPASDVDLIYELYSPVEFERWTTISETLESVLGKVVDAHRATGERPPNGAQRVWTAPYISAKPPGGRAGERRPTTERKS